MATINLNDQGLSEGDDITNYLDGNHAGDTVQIEGGEYQRTGAIDVTLNGTVIEGINGQVVINHPSDHELGVEWICNGDSTVRNLTFAGRRGFGGPNKHHAVETAGGAEMTFENVNWPDGTVDPSDAHAMYLRGGCAGPVTFRRCYFRRFGDNAIYGSPPGEGGNGGPLQVEECWFVDNNVAAVRFGGDESYVEDSYIEVTGNPPGQSTNAVNSRGVWIHSAHDYRIENCDIVFDSPYAPVVDYPNTGNADIEMINNRIRQDGSGGTIMMKSGSSVTGSGNHLTGSGNISTQGSVSGVACTGSGCDSPSEPAWDPLPGVDDPVDSGGGGGSAGEVLDVTEGTDISNEIETALSSGAHATIPGGNYQLQNPHALEVAASDDTILEGDGEVVLDMGTQDFGNNRIEHDANGCEITFRNITLDGSLVGGKGGFNPIISNNGALRYENFNVVADCDGNYIGWIGNGISSGTLFMHGCTLENFTNNGLYMDQPGSNFHMDVRGCVFRHINIDAIRAGNDGDVIDSNVFVMHRAPNAGTVGGPTGRGVRMDNDGDVLVRNNDFVFDYSGADSPIVVTDSAVGGTLALENNRIWHDGSADAMRSRSGNHPTITGSGNHMTGSNTSVEGAFEHTIACSGSGCDEPSEAPPDTEDPDEFLVLATSSGELDYELRGTGTIRRGGTGDLASESNDSITENDDGSFTVSGFTGNAGFGDTYLVNGTVDTFEINTPEEDRCDFRLEWNGEDVTQQYTTEGDLFVIKTEGLGELEYEFRVDGSVNRAGTGTFAADTDDTISSDGDN